ncbi:tyrosine-protein phosphatase [Dactylosporangium sp. NPDC050688]|uniref:tyrosine-protein phosphatase n=1 Tax=Dactylosporangium sp. NPDC050688 TaxID=3157217 RepID=UPI0033E679BC
MRSYDHPNLFNFRDLGGYRGRGGRTVRWRRLFRSDSLSRIDPADAASFTALGVRTVIDLRRPREVARDGRVPEFAGLSYHHLHPEHAEWEDATDHDEPSDARWLANRYLDIAGSGAAAVVAAVGVIAEADNAPLVVHCVAGKDRTGVVAALTLAALGVAEEDIAEDYALTATATGRAMEHLRRSNPHLATMPERYLVCPAEAMLLFLRDLDRRHGSVRGYLLEHGLTGAHLEALDAHLLEDPA